MKKLYFRRYNKELVPVCNVPKSADMDTILNMISNDVARYNPNYKIYYTRSWKEEDGSVWFDVGSWSEFYVLKEEDTSNAKAKED